MLDFSSQYSFFITTGCTKQYVPTHLPPVRVFFVDYMKDLSLGKGQTCLLTWDQVVCGWVIVEVWLQINLVKGMKKMSDM